ncbi:MAG: M6 family metalloprotease domain-containing protein, partial [Prevotellaceae bacterium]|nr:M6 family metalloprotease domain-containing protein [Prevotellaceae bacterium]
MVFVFVFVFVSTHAIPAWYGVMQHTQEDGTTINYRIMGDEHGHMLVTLDGYALVMDGQSLCYAEASPLPSPEGKGDHPEKGEVEGCGVRVVSTGVMAHNAEMRSETEIKTLATLGKAGPLCPQHLQSLGPRKGMKHTLNIDDFPTTGEVHGLILLVNFANMKMQEKHTVEVFDRKMNEEGCTLYNATGSARDYFIDQSWGQFQPTFDVCGIIELDNNFSYYGHNNGFGLDDTAQLMIKEACEKAHDQMGVDFSKYDYDNDGYVDFVYVIFAGYAESYGAPAETIWPHASNLEAYGINLELDGKKVDKYACSSELKYNSGETIEGIGTFCHEFSHVLGLPDAYNVHNAGDPQLGRWDVMDQGNYNNESNTPASYSAYERKQVGWMDFTP